MFRVNFKRFITHRSMTKKQDIMGTDKTILIAEPTGTLISELESFLLSEGIACIQAKTVQETLLTIQNQQTDTLVLDAALLGEDCSFISVIKNMAKNLPIILCAETNTPEFESRVRQERIFFYHIKSFGSQDLKMAISNAINKLPH